MAGNIHDHISKALLSKEKRLLDKNKIESNADDDAALEARLTAIISQEDEQTKTYWDQEPLNKLSQSNLTEEMIPYLYKSLYNKILEEHQFSQDDAVKEEIHELSEKSIISKVRQLNLLTQFDADTIKRLCQKIRIQELKTHTLCSDIESLRKNIMNFLDEIINLPTTNELSHLIETNSKRIYDPNYAEIHEKINDIISKGIVNLEDDFLIKLLHHAKKLTMISPYDQAMLSSFLMKNASLHSPFIENDLLQFSADIKEFIIDCPTLQVEKESKFIHHALVYDLELIKLGKTNEFLCRFDISEIKQKSLSTLLESKISSILQNNENINPNVISDIDRNLSDCQKLVQDYGYTRIASSINRTDYDMITQMKDLHHNIIAQSDSLNILLDLQTALETINQSTLLEPDIEILAQIIENLELLNNNLTFLFNTLLQPGFDKPYNQNIFFFRLGRGDFFGPSERYPLYLATFAIHKAFNPNNILDAFIENFNNYTNEQKEACLEFVKNMIMLDTSNSMIPVKYETNELIHKFEIFCQFILSNIGDNTDLEEKLNEISNLLINKIVEKGRNFSEYLNDISKNKIPSKTLLRNINTINHDFESNKTLNISLLEEYCIEINFILESSSLLSSNDEYTDALENGISYFCTQLLKIPQFENAATDLLNKLSQRKENFFNQQSVQSTPYFNDADENTLCNISQISTEITQSVPSIIDYEKHLTAVVDAIEQGFARRFLKIDINELNEAAWIHDDIRINEGLNPNAPNIRAYLQYYQLVTKFFTIAILCKIEQPGPLVFRESIVETKRMYDFVEKMVLKSIDKGYVATAYALHSIFKIKDIKRLKISNQDAKNLRVQYLEDPQIKLSTLKSMIQEKDGLPLIQSFQNQIKKGFEEQYGSEFEKFVRIGQKLRFIESKKESAKNKIFSEADISFQMINILENGMLLASGLLANDIIINEELFAQTIEKASLNIRPLEFKEYSTHDIPSINDLKELILYWHNRLEDFHFVEKNPEKHIFELVCGFIQNDENFSHLEEAISILDLVALIEESKGREYKNLHHDLAGILSIYYKHILKHLKSDAVEPESELEIFFSIYNNHPKIKSSRDSTINSLNPFSSPKVLKDIIEKIDLTHKKFNQKINTYIQARGQQTYTELLMKVLEGDNQDPIIHFGTSHQVSTGSSSSLLPDTEFPVPQAEPEHPDYIGINRTMNFNPNTSSRSALEIFETKELQKDFQEAFPWSINSANIKQLENARLNPSINLLATEMLFNAPTQMAVMNYVLLALDCLGKISGYNGELAISNFSKIKMISDTLHDVSNLLLISSPDDEYLNVKIDHMTYKLIVLNQDLVDMLQNPNPDYPVQNNMNMNEFCHINEYLAHKLLGVPYQKSILSAMNSDSSILNDLSQTIRNDFLKVTTAVPSLKQLGENNFPNETLNEDE